MIDGELWLNVRLFTLVAEFKSKNAKLTSSSCSSLWQEPEISWEYCAVEKSPVENDCAVGARLVLSGRVTLRY